VRKGLRKLSKEAFIGQKQSVSLNLNHSHRLNKSFVRKVGVITNTLDDFLILYGKEQRYSKFISLIYNRPQRECQRLTMTYLDHFKHLSVHHGEKFAIKRMKDYLNIAERYAMHCKFSPLKWLDKDSEGLPKFLKEYKSFLGSKDTRLKSLALTILNLGRLYECNPTGYDVTSISGETIQGNRPRSRRAGDFFKNTQTDGLDNRRFALSWRRTLNLLFPTEDKENRLKELSSKSSFHLSGRNGPNGHALGKAYRDFIALVRDEKCQDSKLLQDIFQMSELTGFTSLSGLITEFREDKKLKRIGDLEITEGVSHSSSRISLKQGEPWWKERIFAVGDFFSQSALKGMQVWLFGQSRKNNWKFDGSLDHHRVATIVRDWSKVLTPYSKDLTTATDLLPVQLLEEIQIQMFGKEVAGLWYNIMTQRDFNDKLNGNTLRYKTGSPMGLNTSWYMLHIFQICIFLSIEDYLQLDSSLCEEEPNFVVIGDDSATWREDISNIYDTVVSYLCGIPQSPNKGYQPSDVKDGKYAAATHPAELAKRLFLNGVEISHVSSGSILNAMQDISSLGTLLRELESKGIMSKDDSNLGANLANCTNFTVKSFLIGSFPLFPWPGFNRVQRNQWPKSKEMDDAWDQRHASSVNRTTDAFLLVALGEILRKHKATREWVVTSYNNPIEELMSVSDHAVKLDSQESLSFLALEQVTTMLIDSSLEEYAPEGYGYSELSPSYSESYQSIKSIVQNILILDEVPKLLGMRRKERIRLGKDFSDKLSELIGKVYTKQVATLYVDHSSDFQIAMKSIISDITSVPVLVNQQESVRKSIEDVSISANANLYWNDISNEIDIAFK
jgi:hypothetical protein